MTIILANIWAAIPKSSGVLCLQKVRQVVVAQGDEELGLRCADNQTLREAAGEVLLLYLGLGPGLKSAANSYRRQTFAPQE